MQPKKQNTKTKKQGMNMETMPLHIDNERGSHYKESRLYSAYRQYLDH